MNEQYKAIRSWQKSKDMRPNLQFFFGCAGNTKKRLPHLHEAASFFSCKQVA